MRTFSWNDDASPSTSHQVASDGSPSSPSSSSLPGSSPSSSGSTTSTLTINNASVIQSQISHSDSIPFDTNLPHSSASSSRSTSFAENFDRLAVITQSAHKFPAALTSISSPEIHQSDNHSSSSSSIRSASRSTPSSPRLAPLSSLGPERRAVSRPSSPSFSRRSSGIDDATRTSTKDEARSRRRRARSWVNTPGAGFTPATSLATPNSGATSSAQHRMAPHRQSSSSGTNVGYISSSDSPFGRMRSTSASTAFSPPQHIQTSRPLARSQQHRSSSARTSPTSSPLHAMSPVESSPQRTHSVPQFPRISPIIYGYGYHIAPPENGIQSQQMGVLDGYFALPPPPLHSTTISSHSPILVDDVPPPYTSSQVELQALVGGQAEIATVPTIPTRGQQLRGSEGEDDGEEMLSFSTQGREERQREGEPGSLRRRRTSMEQNEGSAASPTPSVTTTAREEEPSIYRRSRLLVLVYFLHPLRLLAAVPGCIGTFWLLRNAFVLLWLERRFWSDDGKPGALEFGLASLWSISTAYHAISFTTLLLRRWLHYYSILPSFIRLIALQAICWPLVRLTLYILGPKNPLAGWVIISTTTAFSDTVARWVVSNITHDDATSSISENAYRSNRKKKRKKNGMAFWKAVMGGPSDNTSNGSISGDHRFPSTSSLSRRHHHITTTTESEAESDVDSLRFRRTRPGWDGYFAEVASGGEDSAVEAVANQRVARIFHWDVAIRRNVLPIAVLAYLSLWALLIEQVRQRE